MGIPNVKRFKITSPDGKDTATLMAVVPPGTNLSSYLPEASKRFDWKSWSEQRASMFKVRVGQQKQVKKK